MPWMPGWYLRDGDMVLEDVFLCLEPLQLAITQDHQVPSCQGLLIGQVVGVQATLIDIVGWVGVLVGGIRPEDLNLDCKSS